MFTVRKFLYCCAVLGALAFLGTTLAQMAANENRLDVHGLPSGAGIFLQTASAEAGPAVQRTLTTISSHLQSFTDSARTSLRRYAVTAQLQLGSMPKIDPTHFTVGDWMPRSAPNWIQGGAESAAQAAGSHASDLAKKVPVVSSVIDSTKSRFAAVRDSLNGF
jgi:hypothetical protein